MHIYKYICICMYICFLCHLHTHIYTYIYTYTLVHIYLPLFLSNSLSSYMHNYDHHTTTIWGPYIEIGVHMYRYNSCIIESKQPTNKQRSRIIWQEKDGASPSLKTKSIRNKQPLWTEYNWVWTQSGSTLDPYHLIGKRKHCSRGNCHSHKTGRATLVPCRAADALCGRRPSSAAPCRQIHIYICIYVQRYTNSYTYTDCICM